MDGGSDGSSEARFAAYVEQLGTALGHADRQEPLHDYCLGLLMPIERKSVEPMAAVTAPAQVAAKHQSLLHFVGNAPWSDAAMLAKVSELVRPAIERRADRGVDHRRHWVSQKGAALGGGDPTILR
jgi:SRSO17 transposase